MDDYFSLETIREKAEFLKVIVCVTNRFPTETQCQIFDIRKKKYIDKLFWDREIENVLDGMYLGMKRE